MFNSYCQESISVIPVYQKLSSPLNLLDKLITNITRIPIAYCLRRFEFLNEGTSIKINYGVQYKMCKYSKILRLKED